MTNASDALYLALYDLAVELPDASARRAMTRGLQLACDRPESADRVLRAMAADVRASFPALATAFAI